MKPGRELDALIAEKVMGWERKDVVFIDNPDPHNPESFPETRKDVMLVPPDYNPSDYSPPSNFSLEQALNWKIPTGEAFDFPHFSTSIADAWEVFEKLGDGYGLQIRNGKWIVFTGYHDWIAAEGETAPHAICLAALEAIETK